MNTTARLDAILAKHTAIRSFAELLATAPGYAPTLDLREAPALYEVAVALVHAGRDAYLKTVSGARVFASALAYKAPEVLAAEYGISIPKPAAPRLRGTTFAAFGETWLATGGKARGFDATGGVGIVARRWNRARGAFNKSERTLRVTLAFVFENEVERARR